MRLSHILGLNGRFNLYSYPNNSRKAKKIAASKLAAKRVLAKAGLPVPEVYARFREPQDVFKFDWNKLPESFAFKPARGLGGEGIVVVKKRSRESTVHDPIWVTTQRKRVTREDLQLTALDILEGAYNAHNVPDIAFAEEYVGRHKAFRRFAYRGTPDIRLIVFNRVPVMAMLRLPTKESGGRANLHQGAVGVGIDIATGITTYGVHHGQLVKFKPGTKRKLHGIKIPYWDRILEIASMCQEASGLGYLGVDIVLHPEKGPMILELNSEPGLEIQLANLAGLHRRLDKVEDLKVERPEQAVKIAKALFASHFAARVKASEKGQEMVGVFEDVLVKGEGGKKVKVGAKLDTGAWRTSIDRSLARRLGLLDKKNILWTKVVKSSLGSQKRPIISLIFWLKGKKIVTSAGVSNRRRLRKLIIIGRRDLGNFLVLPRKTS